MAVGGRTPETTFGQLLCDARESAGLRVDELAAAVGVQARTIVGWERGRARPRVTDLLALADALDRNIDELLLALEADRVARAGHDDYVLLDAAELQHLIDAAEGRLTDEGFDALADALRSTTGERRTV